ncbi:hypothetical protein EXN66_Car015433 [Channa argus]|uniref:Uncharacterized protein n=1 Tax=Channa argus TaxID=215402 RepID=A0A6G1QC83_CHAAH|nr:hypothetical protein EXN66_Car015433 [Channa argus]
MCVFFVFVCVHMTDLCTSDGACGLQVDSVTSDPTIQKENSPVKYAANASSLYNLL